MHKKNAATHTCTKERILENEISKACVLIAGNCNLWCAYAIAPNSKHLLRSMEKSTYSMLFPYNTLLLSINKTKTI